MTAKADTVGAPSPRRPGWRRRMRAWLRRQLALAPRSVRFGVYRRMVECDPAPDPRLVLKIAETREELEACFRLLHDAYVAEGFMKPHPSGLRVTPYHALPTTTTLCAKFDGRVAGTLSIVREGVFGFPMQSAFDLTAVRARGGRIAEISALAVAPEFRRTGGAILFPLMKFMYEYCTQYFDTRHLVIAVNPDRIELYEALLMFERVQAQVVERYDFANGAPAVGATLDLQTAPGVYREVYGDKPERRNLHRYFVETRLPHIRLPERRLNTSNDPVMTPELLHHFFVERTDGLARLDPRRLELLHAVYRGRDWHDVMPAAPASGAQLRQHPRFSMNCPATLSHDVGAIAHAQRATVIDISQHGCMARTLRPLPVGTRCRLEVTLGEGWVSRVEVVVVRNAASVSGHFHGFFVETPDAAWRRCVAALEASQTHDELARRMAAEAPVRQAAELEPA